MNKVFSLALATLISAAMLHLSVAEHYCGGKETALKVSVTGKLAECSMEYSEKELPPLSGTYFTKHCCDDVVISCGIDNNYEPSYSFVPEFYKYNFQIFSIPSWLSHNSYYTDLIPIYTNVSPPAVLMSTKVDLSDICVFRI